MKSLPTLHCAVLPAILLGSCAERPAPAATTPGGQGETSSEIAVAQKTGAATVRPLSAEGLRQEFRYLAQELRKIELSGPPVQTDGGDENFQKAEWPFMAIAYFAYGCAELARCDESVRSEAIREALWATEALQTRRLSGFMEEHYGKMFAATPEEQGASILFHGHFLNTALRYRAISGDSRFDPVVRRVAEALLKSFESSIDGILSSYPRMYWLSDNFVGLSALARYGRTFGVDVSSPVEKAMRTVREHYIDRPTGLFATYVRPEQKRISQGPRGISVMYGVVFLQDFAPDFARDQWVRAKEHLIKSAVGLAAVREFPLGHEGSPDGDSGPVLLGLGLSASGFAIPAAGVMRDRAVGWSLMRAAVALGGPVLTDGRLHYTAMPRVGQVVTFYGRVLLVHWRPATE